MSKTAFPFERLNKNDSVLIILDIQVGLYQLARDFDPTLYQQNILAHAALGKVFDIPTIITTSAETGKCPACCHQLHPLKQEKATPD